MTQGGELPTSGLKCNEGRVMSFAQQQKVSLEIHNQMKGHNRRLHKALELIIEEFSDKPNPFEKGRRIHTIFHQMRCGIHKPFPPPTEYYEIAYEEGVMEKIYTPFGPTNKYPTGTVLWCACEEGIRSLI